GDCSPSSADSPIRRPGRALGQLHEVIDRLPRPGFERGHDIVLRKVTVTFAKVWACAKVTVTFVEVEAQGLQDGKEVCMTLRVADRVRATNVVELRLSGTLHRDDTRDLIPQFERVFKEYGSV